MALLRLAKRGVHTLQFSSLTSSIQRIELCCTTGLSHRSLLGCTWHKCVERVQRHGKSRMVDPGALGSDDFPMGLPDLTAAEKQRVELANSMYWETCRLFGHCASQGILVTLETHPGVYSGKRFPINSCLMLMRFHSATLKCV